MRMTMANAARDLVIRSRAGDQNAMAIISLVGQQARREGPNRIKAKVAYRLIKNEVDKSRPGDDIGVDKIAPPKPFLEGLTEPNCWTQCLMRAITYSKGFKACLVTIANGPPIDVGQWTACIENLKDARPTEQLRRAAMRILRKAQRIQWVRNPRCPVRKFSEPASWELGE